MKLIILIIVVISSAAFSLPQAYPAPEDSYENEDFESEIYDYTLIGRSDDQGYLQKMKNYFKNMKDKVKNSKFYQSCIKINDAEESESNDEYDTDTLKNQTIVIEEPTNEQRESCWNYIKNKGSKAKKWFAGWFPSSRNESDSIDDEVDQTTMEIETTTAFSPTIDDSKIYFEDMLPTEKSQGFWKSVFG